MRIRELLVLAALACCAGAQAQIVPLDPDWKESDVPPPPAFEIKRLVPFVVNVGTEIKWGIDPATIVVTPERLVRYVVVAQSNEGVTQAMYEAVRCATAEMRIYARFNPATGWKANEDPLWKSLFDAPSRHALVLARAGVCTQKAPENDVRTMVNNIRLGNARYRDN